MSWAEEDWTVGLSGRVLQKVKELQVQHDRLSRESKQKQLQLDNTQATLEKQTLKYEKVRGELLSVQRELQGVCEEAQAGVCAMERLSQEVQSRQSQVCSLEGQLDAARTLTHNLSQEIKRLEAELEKLNNSRAGDSSLFSTPCWSVTSPREHNGGSRKEEEQPGRRGEADNRALHVRQLQFDTPSTPLPRQPNRSTPLRHPSSQSDTFSTPSGAFPWERDDLRPVVRGRGPPSPQVPIADVVTVQGQQELGDCGKKLRKENEELRCRVCSLEAELRAEAGRLKATQEQLGQSRKELAAREISLQKGKDQLSLAHTRTAQECDRASAAEQRARLLQEELKCQRQNTESSRLQHLQRTKDLEKQHQRDLLELQRERQCLEKQHQQEVNRLNQELQQARTLHYTLQAQAEKLSLQKQTLDKEVETLKDKLKWTEGQLQESQKKEAQTQAKLTEALHDAEGVAVALEQSRRRQSALEEEGRRLAQERGDALRLLQELQDQKAVCVLAVPPVQFCPAGQSSPPQNHQLRLQAQTKRPPAASLPTRGIPGKQQQQEEEERGWQTAPKYLSDREPGEGIDSEHTSTSAPPEPQGSRWGGEEGRKLQGSSEKKEGKADELALCSSLPPASSPPTVLPDFHGDSVALRSELRDVREELQRRLEDLEVQRRAEAEARTRLKQLSRKHTVQATEHLELERERKAELERHQAEEERLRGALAALEEEVKRGKEHQGEEDRESELTELNVQLRKQLVEAKAQLALEREERQEEKKERKQDLGIKLAQLEAELEVLKTHGKKGPQEKQPVEAHSPLTYLTLRQDELNSNVLTLDNKLLPSPEQSRQSANQRDTSVSQATEDFIQDATTGNVQEYEGPSTLVGQKVELENSGVSTSELERLRVENAREAGRANQSQAKLEALQTQVTRQTQQLTTAFDRQSQHITDLLTELQLKESALLSQGGELQRCQQELATLKAEKENELEEERITAKEAELRAHQNEPPADESSEPQITNCENEIITEDRSVMKDGEREEASLMSLLEQQVGVLQAELQALSKENQRQAEDLAIWRVASQPIPDTQQHLRQTQGHSMSLDPSESQARHEAPTLGPEEPAGQGVSQIASTVVLIREDELLVSCTSNKLHGRTLATRLHYSSLPKQNDLLTLPKTPQDDIMDISGIDEESEKENIESILCTQSKTIMHKKQKRADIIKRASDETFQKNATKDPHTISGLHTKATKLHKGEPEALAHSRSKATQTEEIPLLFASPVASEICHACTQTGKNEDEEGKELKESPALLSEGAQLGDQRLFASSFPIPADPARLAERIRRNRSQLSAAFDDTEYEPYGLPEVVMKGFADIPSGPACPYIVRRGHLGTAAVPLPQKEPVHMEETD